MTLIGRHAKKVRNMFFENMYITYVVCHILRKTKTSFQHITNVTCTTLSVNFQKTTSGQGQNMHFFNVPPVQFLQTFFSETHNILRNIYTLTKQNLQLEVGSPIFGANLTGLIGFQQQQVNKQLDYICKQFGPRS